MYQVTYVTYGSFGMNFQIESATESGSDTHLLYFIYIYRRMWSGRKRRKSLFLAQSQAHRRELDPVQKCLGDEVQEHVEVGDEVPMRSSPSRNVQPENIHRYGKSLNY